MNRFALLLDRLVTVAERRLLRWRPGSDASAGKGASGERSASWDDLSFMSDDEVAALLLPAVQKIREAAARANASGGGGAGKATFKEFTVTKKTDASAVDGSAADLAGGRRRGTRMANGHSGGP